MRITTIAILFATILSLQPRDMAANLEINTIKFFSEIYMKIEFSSQWIGILLVIAAMTSYANQESIW